MSSQPQHQLLQGHHLPKVLQVHDTTTTLWTAGATKTNEISLSLSLSVISFSFNQTFPVKYTALIKNKSVWY